MEDDPELARAIRERLEGAKFTVDVVAEGEAGLARFMESRHDVLLIQQDLPVRAGLDVVWALAAQRSLPPSIMLARRGDAEIAVQALKLGVGDYLIQDRTRQFVELLPGAIRSVVEQRRAQLDKDRLLAQFQEAQDQLEEMNLALVKLAANDGLTGIANRRLFDEVIERAWAEGLETARPLSLILIDVDYFKPYNDIYGHLAGDDCLRRVARVIDGLPLSPRDLASRYGGEEFAIVLPGRTESEATSLANMLRREVAAMRIPHEGSPHDGIVTVSIGVVARIPTDDCTPAGLIESADNCLYRAKEAGRNWIVSTDLTQRQSQSASGSGAFRRERIR
jgi:two-component system chemotaxis family response regulator WspR